jgi:HPt (histidine-containing phosphotransfer) domain-containing protein
LLPSLRNRWLAHGRAKVITVAALLVAASLAAYVHMARPSAPAPMPTQHNFNGKNFRMLVVGDNPAMHRRLLERFVRNTSEQIPAINAALAESNFKQAGAIAHALKSAARSVGALALGELCQHLETAGKAEDAPACTALSHSLPKAWVDAQALIHKHVANK